jgi:hypothetical protein
MAAPALSPPAEETPAAKGRTAAVRLPEVLLTAAERANYHVLFTNKGSQRGNQYYQVHLARRTAETAALPEEAELAPEARVATPSFRPNGVQISADENDGKRVKIKFTMTRAAFDEAFGVFAALTQELAAALGRDARPIATDVPEVPGIVSFTATAPRALETRLLAMSQQAGINWCISVAYFGCYDSVTMGVNEITCNLQLADMITMRDLNKEAKGARKAEPDAPVRKQIRL